VDVAASPEVFVESSTDQHEEDVAACLEEIFPGYWGWVWHGG